MKKYPLAALAGAVLALSACGGPDPSDDYLNATYQAAQDDGYHISTEGEQARLDVGLAVCAQIDAGAKPDEALLYLLNADVSPEHAQTIVQAALTFLCPEA